MSFQSRNVMVFRPLPAEVGRWDREQCRTVSCLASDANAKRDVKWRGTSNVIEVTEDFKAFVAGLKVGNLLTCCPYDGTNLSINEAADEAGVPKGFIANVVLQFEPPVSS